MEDANAWRHVDKILETSSDQLVMYFAMQILEHAIKYRWGTLPKEQREGIRNYIVQKIIAVRAACLQRLHPAAVCLQTSHPAAVLASWWSLTLLCAVCRDRATAVKQRRNGDPGAHACEEAELDLGAGAQTGVAPQLARVHPGDRRVKQGVSDPMLACSGRA